MWPWEELCSDVWLSSSFLLLDDFHSPGSPLSLLPRLHSSPTSFNLSGWGCKKKKSILYSQNETAWYILSTPCGCGIYQLLSVFWTLPLLCILCIWPGASLLRIQSMILNHCATSNDWKSMTVDLHSPSSCLHFSKASSVAYSVLGWRMNILVLQQREKNKNVFGSSCFKVRLLCCI